MEREGTESGMRKIEYCPLSMKTLLVEMKDTSELMVDLGYSAVLYDDYDLAMEVIRLEEKMDVYDYHVQMAAMLAARTVEDAEALSGVLQIASAAEIISNAAGDIASIVLLKMGIPSELKKDLRLADETVARAVVGADSKVAGKTLEEISFETEAGMSVIAIRRGESWIYDPELDAGIVAGDILFARGHDEGVPLFLELTTGRSQVPKVYQESGVGQLDKALDIIVEMKNRSELAVGLAYTAVLFDNEEVAVEVEVIEQEMDEMKYDLQRWVLRAAKHVDDIENLRGLLHLAVSTEIISDAALKIANVVLHDIEPHPILAMAMRESDEVITRVEIAPGAEMDGKTLDDLDLETETGMYVLAVKRGGRWTYNPKPRVTLGAGDLIFARGSKSGEELLLKMSGVRP
ncbi:MAG TPA: TrkA C-terminal domain-containing protein [Methanothrix sp.]|nr:TrkA C-terminal domain-containing protein [Methanothrix sp.]